MLVKLIAATGSLLGVLALNPNLGLAGQPLHNESADGLLPMLNEAPGKLGAPTLPPPDFAPPEGLRALKRVSYKIQPGDTLTNVLMRYGVTQQDRKLWLQSIQKYLPLAAFRPGKEVDLYLSQPQKGKEQLKAIEVEQNAD